MVTDVSRITELTCSHKSADYVPEDLDCFPALNNLVLFSASFVTLPSSISACQRLQMLGIIDCRRLRSLPSFGKLQALQELMIQDCNALLDLPDGIGELKALKKLTVQDCLHFKRDDVQIAELKDQLPDLEVIWV